MIDVSRFLGDGVGQKTKTIEFQIESAVSTPSPISIPEGEPVTVVSMGCTSEDFYLVEFSYWDLSTNTGAKIYGANNFGAKQLTGATWNPSTKELSLTWAGTVTEARRVFVTVMV